ncbi:MAG: hypothetical protein DDT34_02316 [Firmicutes bacterium]|nr:hypothetical protein [Bacillota bacterium]
MQLTYSNSRSGLVEQLLNSRKSCRKVSVTIDAVELYVGICELLVEVLKERLRPGNSKPARDINDPQ